MTTSEERVGEIESLFRNVNEQIAEAAERFEVESARFYCECHDPACGGRVEVPLDEYEDLRAESTRFVHLPSHVETRFERVWRASGGTRSWKSSAAGWPRSSVGSIRERTPPSPPPRRPYEAGTSP